MNFYFENKPIDKTSTIQNSPIIQKQNNNLTPTFIDNRPSMIIQQNLQETINNSPRLEKLQSIQKMADDNIKNTQIHNSTSNKTIQLEKKYFKNLDDTNELVQKYSNIIEYIANEIDNEVQKARSIALNWSEFNFEDKGYIGLWARTAREYYESRGDKLDEFIYARFGYAIETIACGNLSNSYGDLNIDFQVSEGHTRPDIVISNKDNGDIAWIDITSKGSKDHILDKDGSGWKTKPFVYEILYEPLNLKEVLTNVVNPIFKNIGEFHNERLEVKNKIEDEKKFEFKNSLIKLQEDNEWKSGFGNAKNKQKETKNHLMGLGMNLGKNSQQATHGALNFLEINSGSYGYNKGNVKIDSTPAKRFIIDKSTADVNMAHQKINEEHMNLYENMSNFYQNFDKYQPIINELEVENELKESIENKTNLIETNIYVITSIQVSEQLEMEYIKLETWDENEDHRISIIRKRIETLADQRPNDIDFKELNNWSTKATELINKSQLLQKTIDIQKEFLTYLDNKYGGGISGFFKRTKNENTLVHSLTVMPEDDKVITATEQYMQKNP